MSAFKKAVRLQNGFFVEKYEAAPRMYWYYRPGILCNLITPETADALVEPARSQVLDAISVLEGAR